MPIIDRVLHGPGRLAGEVNHEKYGEDQSDYDRPTGDSYHQRYGQVTRVLASVVSGQRCPVWICSPKQLVTVLEEATAKPNTHHSFLCQAVKFRSSL